jgi:hypothetical protein
MTSRGVLGDWGEEVERRSSTGNAHASRDAPIDPKHSSHDYRPSTQRRKQLVARRTFWPWGPETPRRPDLVCARQWSRQPGRDRLRMVHLRMVQPHRRSPILGRDLGVAQGWKLALFRHRQAPNVMKLRKAIERNAGSRTSSPASTDGCGTGSGNADGTGRLHFRVGGLMRGGMTRPLLPSPVGGRLPVRRGFSRLLPSPCRTASMRPPSGILGDD